MSPAKKEKDVFHDLTSEESKKVQFFVSEDCNGCGLCKSIAPDFFDCVEYAYYYFVTRQPESQSDVDLLRDASSLCVVDALRESSRPHA